MSEKSVDTKHVSKTALAIAALIMVAVTVGVSAHAQTPLENTPIVKREDIPYEKGIVAKRDSVGVVINAVAAQMKRPAIVSAKAAKKQVTGNFNLADPVSVLTQLESDLNLISYSDGLSLYVYDSTEMRSMVGNMRSASIRSLNEFLRKANLSDARFPIRGEDKSGTYYISAPPIYVDIVTSAAAYLDTLYKDADTSNERLEVIKLEHGFVERRAFNVRGVPVLVPGMADIINGLLGQTSAPVSVTGQSGTAEGVGDTEVAKSLPLEGLPTQAASASVTPFPATNSLILRGTFAQVELVKQLIAELDVPRRQIELSVWIIDITRDDLDQLGVGWSGGANVAGKFAIGFNEKASITNGQGARFLSAVKALKQKGAANVVSRPLILTQENVPAVFDHNTTFYTRLVGERTTAMESVTYGTLISVLPRISSKNDIEMQLRIEDGNAARGRADEVDGLPLVGRTNIDTQARVPQNHSLLIGGYTRQQSLEGQSRIPGLGTLPFIGGLFRHREKSTASMVRVFLIQPRILATDDATDAKTTAERWAPQAGLKVYDEVDAIRRRGGGVE